MRVLLCLHSSPDVRTAGVEVHTAALATALSVDHEVSVLVPRAAPGSKVRSQRDEAAGSSRGPSKWKVIEVGSGRPGLSFEALYRGDRETRADIERTLDEFRPDVVHVQHLMGLSSDLPELAQARNIPVVMTVHDHWLECAAGGQRFHRDLGRCSEMSADRCADCTAHLSGPALRVRAALARVGLQVRAPRRVAVPDDEARSETAAPSSSWSVWPARLLRVPHAKQRAKLAQREAELLEMTHAVDRFLAPSRFMRDALVRFGVPGRSIRRIAFGLPDTHRDTPRVLPEYARRFAYLGTIAPHKGVHTLIAAMDALPDDARLDVYGDSAGDPGYAKALRARADHPGIHFHGPLEVDEVSERLREVDCLVVPSLWYENAPLVILEAFAAGIGVIASDLGGHRELLAEQAEEERGLLFAPDAPGALEEALLRVYREAGVLRRMTSGRPCVRSIEDHARETSALYRELIHEFDSPSLHGVDDARYDRMDTVAGAEEQSPREQHTTSGPTA
ncbi:MAG: glycosyltransferase [Myxococcota bacterium]|jgi:glycosyltransferase involved in cell wall biosynthesis|nr:glycosyltransferase [Myxococcota bacterium]